MNTDTKSVSQDEVTFLCVDELTGLVLGALPATRARTFGAREAGTESREQVETTDGDLRPG